jgi:hypothetical protein
MTTRDKRKHPRFKTNLEVIFYDQKRTKGHIIDISKKGCLMTLKDGARRPVGSMITFRVFFKGKAYLAENTQAGIAVMEIGRSRSNQPQTENYPDAVKILAVVVRHMEYEGQPAMGIQIKDLNDSDLVKWNKFMDKINIEQFVPAEKTIPPMPKPAQKPPGLKDVATYILSFKTLDSAIAYLPQSPEDSFFIPSKEQKEGTVVRIVMNHPISGSKFEFYCVVGLYGTNPSNESIRGIFVTYQNLDLSLKHQINTFLGHKLYD